MSRSSGKEKKKTDNLSFAASASTKGEAWPPSEKKREKENDKRKGTTSSPLDDLPKKKAASPSFRRKEKGPELISGEGEIASWRGTQQKVKKRFVEGPVATRYLKKGKGRRNPQEKGEMKTILG